MNSIIFETLVKLREERRTVDHAMGRVIERIRSGEPAHEEDLVEVRGSSELFAELAEKFSQDPEMDEADFDG